MTLPVNIAAGVQPPAPRARAVWRAEIVETVRLALPIALTQLGQIAMMTTDLALIGRLGDSAVAAAALGAYRAVRRPSCSAWAWCRRSRRWPRRPSARASRAWCAARCASGLWAAVLLGVPLTSLQLWGEDILLALGQTPRPRALAGALSRRARLVPDPGLVVHRAARLHGRGQPAGAGALDHACRDSGQCAARLCADLRRVRPAAARPARRRPRDHDRQPRHVRRRDLGLLCAPAVPQISRARPLLAPDWRADAASWSSSARRSPAPSCWNTACSPSAALLMGWIGTTALAAHQIALQIAVDPVHGAVRHLAGGDRARRPRGRPARRRRHAPRRLRRDRARRRLHGGDDAGGHRARATIIPLLFLGGDARRQTPTPSRSPPRCWLVGATFFIADGVQSDRGRRAARAERHARADAVRRASASG